MARRSLSAWFLVLVTALVAAWYLGSGGVRAQGSEWADLDPALPPASLPRDGQSLPGRGYPWQPEARPVPAARAPSAPPTGVDLDVTYIQREPAFRAYCVQYPGGVPTLCPGTEDERRWPDPGEVVTFTAHIVNKGTVASPAFDYVWTLDGAEVQSGTLPGLAPAAETTVTHLWAWAHAMDGERVLDHHTLRFAVDTDGQIAETYENNNHLEDRTDALAFRLAITPEMIQAYDTPWNPAFSYSAEDWLQRQVAAMNGALAASTYATTPGGATVRVRIDSIVVTSSPPPWDRSTDGGWFVDADYRLYSAGYDPVSDVDWNLVHELSHQIGLIDLYNLNLSTTSVKVLDRNEGPANFGFTWPRPGLMGGGDITPHTDPRLYSSHSAAGLSSTQGYRRGYYGEYQFDLPMESYLRVLDSKGNPASGVQVAAYQREGPHNWVGELDLDGTPELSGTTGTDGRLLLDNRSVGEEVTTRTGHTLRANPFGLVDVVGGRNRMLVQLRKGDHEEFAWLDITQLNLAFWAGDTLSHTLTLSAHLPPPGAPAPPVGAVARVEGDRAVLCWQPSPSEGVVGTRVYRAAPPTYEYQQLEGLVTGPCHTETYGATRIYAMTAVDDTGRESGFSNFAWAPRLVHPAAVALASGGLRTVLDRQNGYALLRQQPDGRYLQNVGSVHYHLEDSFFMAVDAHDRLVFSHPGDDYSPRHSVRVAGPDATPILEFGQRGSGPGEFETPAGVAAVGQLSTIEGPYDVDAHTLLLLHFDGAYDGAQGEPGAPDGTAFATGRYGQGMAVDAGDSLTYATSGNLARAQGAVEFWLRPDWPGGDGQGYVFFEAGDTWFNRLRISKDGANNLRFMVWDNSTEYGVAYKVAHWEAGEWHHVAATWGSNEMALFVDGQQRDSRADARPPDLLADTLYVGSSSWHDMQAGATLDELRISDVPRVGASGGVPYRLLVADSGHHRLQAFDELGHFITAYGQPGSEAGQFLSPQGLAVGPDGRVVVADRDNHRLQVLSFDGATFDHLQTITAGFQAPTGVAVDGDGRILVADTGNDRVVILDASGALLAEVTEPDDGYMGSFNRPRGVTWDGSGRLVVADTGNRRVVTATWSPPEWYPVYLPLIRKSPRPPEPPGCYPALWTSTPVGAAPHGVALNIATGRVYVGDHAGDTLSIVDGETGALLDTVPAGDGPNGVAYNPASDKIYVANRDASTVTVLRAGDYAQVATIPVGSLPDGLAVDDVANRIYVANYGSGNVSVLDGDTGAVLQTLAAGPEPAMIAVNRLTGKAYVSLHGAGQVAVIDRAGALSRVDLYSAGPYGVAVDAQRNLVYVATIETARIAVLDGSTDTFLGWVEVREAPGGALVPLRMVAVDPVAGSSGHLFVTTAGSDGGGDKLLLFPKGWPESLGQPYALALQEPREGIAFDPVALRVWVTSRASDRLVAYLDGEPLCPAHRAASGEYELTFCTAGPASACQEAGP